jgi:short-subunit dehydrogenase
MPLNKPVEDWKSQRVWVIGASSGIGRAFAQALILRGAKVAVTARSRQALSDLAASAPGRTLALAADVTRAEELASAYSAIKAEWGGVDLAVFVAGTHRPIRAWELRLDDAKDLFEVNVYGVLAGLCVVLPDFVARGSGAVAIVSSVAGYRGLPTGLIYGATKAALINLTETLYLDLAPKGVGVHLVNPGFVRTPLTDRNEFKMPALIPAEEAAEQMLRGLERGEFEVHFPRRFTGVMKLLRILPYRLYFPLVRRFTGL